MDTHVTYAIQTGKGKGSYSNRYVVDKERQAWLLYQAINVRAPYKKRLIANGKVIHRCIPV